MTFVVSCLAQLAFGLHRYYVITLMSKKVNLVTSTIYFNILVITTTTTTTTKP